MKAPTNLLTRTLILLVLTLMLSACNRAYKMVERGQYDGALALELKRLAGKKNKNPKHVAYAEEAFRKATQRDMDAINDLKNEDNPENWEAILRIAEDINRRQEIVEPLLPIYDKKGRKAAFRFVKVAPIIAEAKESTVEYFYTHAKKLLAEAKRGDKTAARDAFYELEKIDRHYRNYKDKNRLKDEAIDLGKTRMIFKMVNDAQVVIPAPFEREILRIGLADLNSLWNEVSLIEDAEINYDYSVVMSVSNIDVSPESIHERQYIDEKEVFDGWDYVLDGNGNVMKDTLGNDIKIERTRWIRADVFESLQKKYARVGGRLEYFDNQRNELVRTDQMEVNTVFEHFASTFSGDRRALSNKSLRCIDNRPIPFPRDEEMLLDAANELKPIIKSKIRQSRLL